jgi:hypothetical protein
VVTGSEPFGFNGVTFDSFFFNIPTGLQLDSITLTSFSGVAQGFTLAPPGPLDTATRYGFLNLGPGDVGSDFLPALLLSDAGKTQTAPLPAGTYWVLLGSVANTEYQYTFDVSAVPEPATVLLTGLGVVAVSVRRRVLRRRGRVSA